jgi:hypothetical protein
MSNKHDALKFLAAGGTPLVVDIFNELKDCELASTAVVLMSSLKNEGLAEIAGKEGKQNRWRITDAGRKALEELDAKASGGGERYPQKKRGRLRQITSQGEIREAA